MFETLHGNEVIKAYLSRALEEAQVPQTLLFEGMGGIGKSLFAKELAAALLKSPFSRIQAETHPDFHALRPEGKSALHAIDDLRKCIQQVYEAPFESQKKVFLIYDAERMQAPSANALLKTLEEPPLDTTIILLTSHAEEILPTIISRCIQLHFSPLSTEVISEILKEKGYDPRFALQAQGSIAKALLFETDPSLGQMQKILLNLLSKPVFYPDLLENLEKIEQLLDPVKEENPLSYVAKAEFLFATLSMWARDQMLYEVGGASLFFPDEPYRKHNLALSCFEERLQEAKTAFQRNLKLSTCLQYCFMANG